MPRFPFLNLFRRRSSVNSYTPLYIPGSSAAFDALDSISGAGDSKLAGKARRQVEEIIGDRYAAGNRRLSGQTGIDLSAYGYY